LSVKDNSVDDRELIAVNAAIRNHPIEQIGQNLRGHMTDMKKVV
jgi:ketol-acid reductoisomerase